MTFVSSIVKWQTILNCENWNNPTNDFSRTPFLNYNEFFESCEEQMLIVYNQIDKFAW